MDLSMYILAVGLLLLESTHAVHVPCISRTDMDLTLDDMIHTADVVLSGRIRSPSESTGDFGTIEAQVSYYYAYKSDNLLIRRALGHVQVENFSFLPNSGQTGLFFLVREPNFHLALYCMADLRRLAQHHDLQRVLEHVNQVSSSDMEKAKYFVPPYPYPCDSNNTNYCSPHGSQCSTVNKPAGSPIRCTCNTGFYGNGTNCTATTKEAAYAECPDCSYGARCIRENSDLEAWNHRSVFCSCDHFGNCEQVKRSAVCGSNRITYSSVCHMKLDACRRQTDIHVLHNDACRPELEVQPCMGMGLPLSTSAGFVKCSESNECPAQYFCHPTDQYQVCCPVKVTNETQTSPPPNSTDSETTHESELPDPITMETPTSSGDSSLDHTSEELIDDIDSTSTSISGSGSGHFAGDDEE